MMLPNWPTHALPRLMPFVPDLGLPVLVGDLTSVLLVAGQLMAILLAPFIAFALLIHWLEYVTSRRLAERFGWHSVLWTGWLGTPIHELSHAFMCRVFHHKIEEIALFEPDRESGRLGYVRHSFQPGNWYQELGNFFIGIAPLLGGSAVLVILMWMFYPAAFSEALNPAVASEAEPLAHVHAIAWNVTTTILRAENLLTARFWLFLYLVLCVGSHMAPSPSDYHGASRGLFLVGGGLLVFALILAIMGTDARSLVDGMIGILGPLFAMLGLAILLCGISGGVVWLLTTLVPRRIRL